MALRGRAVRSKQGPEPPTVLISIDDDLLRVGLSRLLEDEDLAVMTEGPANVVLVDAGADFPGDAPVVALCGDGRDSCEEAMAALERGAAVVLDRASPPDVIAAGIRLAAAGAVAMSSETAQVLLAAHTAARNAPQPLDVLSPREAEVLDLLSTGHGNDQIASDLMIAASTVKNHVARIMVKLGARNRTDAAVIAERLKLGA